MSNKVTNACKPLVMTPAQKSVLMCLADRADDDGVAWPSVPGICEWTCLGRTAVMLAVKRLEDAGWVRVDRQTGRNNRVTIDLKRAGNQSTSRTGPLLGLVHLPDPTSPPPTRVPVHQPDGSSPPPGPDTSIHQEDTSTTSAGAPATTSLEAAKLPACPHLELIDLFGKHLPLLPQPRPEAWQGKSADHMRARWRWVLTATRRTGERYATTSAEALAWFALFFETVADSDFLSGRNGKWDGCTLQWLMKAENFGKVIQGNYDAKDRRAA